MVTKKAAGRKRAPAKAAPKATKAAAPKADTPKTPPKLPERADLGIGHLAGSTRQSAPQSRGTRKQPQQRRTAKGQRS